MNNEKLLDKPFQVFLGIFYTTLCLGTFILERNDNIYNAFLFFIFFLLALFGQSRTLNYKYLTGGGENIWDQHAKKGLYFSGQSFEIKSDDEFYFERYSSAKNFKIDNVRRVTSYGMIIIYFLVLYFSGSLSHSFLNIIPFLVCLAILKTTYLGHYLIPLLINILGVGYAYTQYDLHLDFFTICYIFLIFVLLILYRKIEQQQIHYGNNYFKMTLPWDRGERKQIALTAGVFTLLLISLLIFFLYLTPSKWGNTSEQISEFTQIKSQRIAKWALKYVVRPSWLKRDISDTGSPLKEFDKGLGEKISSGEKSKNDGSAKSLKFGPEEGRLFPLGDEKGEQNKSGLKIKNADDSSNKAGKPPNPTQADNKGPQRRLDDQANNETSQGGNKGNAEGQSNKPNNEDQAGGTGGTSSPDSKEQVAPTPTSAPGSGLSPEPTPGQGPNNTSGEQQTKSPQDAKDKSDQGGNQKNQPKENNYDDTTGKEKGNPGKEKGNPQGSSGTGKGEQGNKGQSSGGGGGSTNQQDQKNDKDKESTQQEQNKNDQAGNNQDEQFQQNSDNQQSQSEQENEDDIPWWYWLVLAAIIVLLSYGLYYFKKRKGIRQINFASPLREDLRQDWDRIQTLNLSPDEEIITRFNFFQKVSHHLLPNESIKLPASLYSQLVIEQFPRIKKQVEYITRTFSDVYYGEEPANAEILKHYRSNIKQIFEFFRF